MMCPLPLWERATRTLNDEEWVRGQAITPHPFSLVEPSALPSPTRGEGAITATFPRASVSQCDVDFLQQPSAALKAADVRNDFSDQLSDRRAPRDVRHYCNFGMRPEWALRRQRLGPQRVKRRVRQLPRIERGDQVAVHHMPAAPDVHQH